MARRNRGGHNYKFTEKTHSVRGVVAIILSILSFAACGVLIYLSYSNRGNAGIYIGSAGILGFFISVIAFITAVMSIREQETFRVVPYASLGVSLISLAVWITIYLGGIGWNG